MTSTQTSEKLKLNDAPCDCFEELEQGFICERCYCGNNGDLADMAVFCHEYNKQVSESEAT